jgi:hypothetical protein
VSVYLCTYPYSHLNKVARHAVCHLNLSVPVNSANEVGSARSAMVRSD